MFDDVKCRVNMIKKFKQIKKLEMEILDLIQEAQKHGYYYTPDMFEFGMPSKWHLAISDNSNEIKLDREEIITGKIKNKKGGKIE